MKLTPRERKILHIAQFQADIPIHEIARQAGMREHTVRHCIGSLLSRGIVEPVTLINLTALGFTEYLLYFSLAPVSAERRRSILKTILETESVSWASRVSGEYQFAVLLVVKSQLEIRLFLERLSDQNGEIFGRKAFSALNSWNYYPCKHLLNIKGKQPKVRFEQPPVVANYDETDHRILKELSQHPERSRKAAAEKLGLPLSTLRYRVDKLVENEVISGFIFNPVLRTVGTLVYRWLVEVKGKSTRITKGLEKFCEQHPHVVSLADCTGAWDYEIRVELYNAVEVPKFSDELMDHLGSSLNSLRIQSVIERLKWAGYPFSAFPG